MFIDQRRDISDVVEVEAGKNYYLHCSCGKSAAQPFCDGTHQKF
ncbi:MAG: CDGSH iron-sulfur domain-containing protein [Ferrovum myxofaciens]|uniref:CDGSH iron-sulfur domain-containing protein n=1 Tax=Ferrovum myxofaciens TaxID=416213 RepID=A0A9E6N123_9PROT|nr:CDGSH iron-sulfur domain-containing protein [Ferrovum myxofaciens]QKE39651.1 MAG: CDGSH iron-sulfur domain-containing protein [Ferrovum myxofaciens]QKE42195.1 MAG: CDGSH iron-sulfur domain-containing protein [Ferrovum myxofaciens]QWY76117.1 MAG: CDGSH iron-sulfur domain-containing protein [Ferrovum myxofaciens]QWY78780.1 MAG: CDGSH iron-sulfur domain-containing protein [Ferrovum myxofaciens]